MDPLRIPRLNRRRTKIVATLGPASSDVAVIERLICAGVNVFRLNMSHGEHATHRLAFQRVREAAARLNEPIAVLADLCGPKIRVGRFANGSIELSDGQQVTVTTRDIQGSPGLIPSQYEALARDVRPGDRILLDDGLLELRVESSEETEVHCSVVHGGMLKDRKGMNLPGVNVSAPALTDKDREDARFALELGVDFLALSFVRRSAEVRELQSIVAAAGRSTHVVAKIEKPEALEAIDEILQAADAIMVARGDLGVELPPEYVPIAQHQLVTMARKLNKPVIVATQMLESMIEHARPTRAEVSDVSHAVFSGADAVMLSAETAAGAFPVAAVEMMDAVARQVEGWQWSKAAFGMLNEPTDAPPPLPLADSVARSTALLARDLKARTIVVLSNSGNTARVISDARPAAPIVALSPDAETCRRMNLLWGVVPLKVSADEFAQPAALARRVARELHLASDGDSIVTVAGLPTIPSAEMTPTISVLRV